MFPPNELCSSKLVYFQGGVKVDEWDWKQPSFWAEVTESYELYYWFFFKLSDKNL